MVGWFGPLISPFRQYLHYNIRIQLSGLRRWRTHAEYRFMCRKSTILTVTASHRKTASRYLCRNGGVSCLVSVHTLTRVIYRLGRSIKPPVAQMQPMFISPTLSPEKTGSKSTKHQHWWKPTPSLANAAMAIWRFCLGKTKYNKRGSSFDKCLLARLSWICWAYWHDKVPFVLRFCRRALTYQPSTW